MRGHPRRTRLPYTTLFRSPAGGALERLAQFGERQGLAGLDRDEQFGAVEVGRRRRDLRKAVQLPDDGAGAGRAEEPRDLRSEEHTSELQSRRELVCRLLLE